MTHRLLNLLTVLLLLLCVAAAALWVRSHRVGDEWLWVGHPSPGAPEQGLSLSSHGGQFTLDWGRRPLDPPRRYGAAFAHEVRRPPPPFWWATTGGVVRSFWSRRGLIVSDTDLHVPARFVTLGLACAACLCRFVHGTLVRRARAQLTAGGHDPGAPPGRHPESWSAG